MHSHQRVGFFLLLENSGGRLVDLWQVSNFHLSDASGAVYIFVLASGWIPENLLATHIPATCRKSSWDLLGQVYLRLGVIWLSRHVWSVWIHGYSESAS